MRALQARCTNRSSNRVGEPRKRNAAGMPPLVRAAALDALAVLFPVECAGCGAPDRAVCSGCRLALVPNARRIGVVDCGAPIVSALRYDGVPRAVLLAFKESGRTDAAKPLALALRCAIEVAAVDAAGAVELCVIPSSRAAARRRGYRPVDELVRRAGLRAARVLQVSRATAQQKSLGRDAREGNVRESFRSRHPLHGRRFVLVDDIVTTGATLNAAAAAIASAGGVVAAAATVAFTPRIRPENIRA
ncbi:MAG: ComF family protein [Cryobacterium sp.]|nr:ComF family protein [Cryobacterium sp.]